MINFEAEHFTSGAPVARYVWVGVGLLVGLAPTSPGRQASEGQEALKRNHGIEGERNQIHGKPRVASLGHPRIYSMPAATSCKCISRLDHVSMFVPLCQHRFPITKNSRQGAPKVPETKSSPEISYQEACSSNPCVSNCAPVEDLRVVHPRLLLGTFMVSPFQLSELRVHGFVFSSGFSWF